jgi:hypothetical protein
MIAVVATLALFTVAGTFVLSSVVPMTIPTNDPHGVSVGDVYTIPTNDPHSITPVSGLSVLTIPTNDPHCIVPVFDLSVLTIPTNDPH